MNAKNQKGVAILPIIILLAVLIASGFYIASRSDDDAMMQKEGDEAMEGDAAHVEAEKKEGEAMREGEVPYAGSLDGAIDPFINESGTVRIFTESGYQNAIKESQLVVLYFYANWCPLCKAEFPELLSAFDKVADKPVVAFRVNFKDSETSDDEIALAKQFGVAYQHTKVFVKGGVQTLKSPESWDEARYVAEINKALQ